jgi:hypothetical protein
MKRISVVILAVIMTVTMIPFIGFAYSSSQDTAQDENTVRTLDETEYPIVKGVSEKTVNMRNASDQSIVSHVLTVKPDSNVSFKASYGNYYTEGSTAASRKQKAENWSSADWNFMTTTQQAANYEKATGQRVLAATNCDYFNMSTGQPVGSIIMEGNKDLNANNTEPYFAVLKDGSCVLRDYNVPKDDVVEGVSGPCFLVKDGKVCTNVPMDVLPRNSIGIKADGSVVIVETDGRIEKSEGITSLQLGNYLKSLGCVDAMLLDGGGSATLATRREGSGKLEISNTPSDGTERVVSSALLLVDNGTVSSDFDHAAISPKNEYYTPGSKVNFSASGVSTSGDKVDIPEGAEWAMADDSKDYGTIDASTGEYQDNGKTAERHKVTVELKKGDTVLGTGSIVISAPDKIKFANDSLNLDYEQKSDLNLRAYANGRRLQIKDGDINWKIVDSTVGKMDGNTFIAAANNAKGTLSVKSEITASSKWDSSVNATVTVGIGTAPVVVMDGGDSDGLNYQDIPYTHSGSNGLVNETYPDSKSDLIVYHYNRGGVASAKQIGVDDGPVRFGQKALQLNYDFTGISGGTEGACVGFKKAITIPGSPTEVGVWVYAPEGTPNLWLRLQYIDGNGKSNNLDFTDQTFEATDGTKGGINWVGWKYVTCKLKYKNGGSIPLPITIPAGQVLRVMDTNGNNSSPEKMNTNGIWNCTKDAAGNVSEAKYIGHSKGTLYFDNLQFVYGNTPEDTDNPVITGMSVGSEMGNKKSLLSGKNVTVNGNEVYISSRYHDVENSHSSGLDWAKLYIDGTDVSGRNNCKVIQNDGEANLYGLKLANGTHSVTLRVRDKNGNESKLTKQFTVKGDNEGLTSVSVTPKTKKAWLGKTMKFSVTSSDLKNVKSTSMNFNLGTNCQVQDVEFKNGFTGTHVYDEKTGTMKFTANAPESLPDDASEDIAEITVSIPQKQTNPAYLTYSVSDGKVECVNAADDSVLNTFATGTKSMPIKAAYTIQADTVVEGTPAEITVKDAEGSPASGVTVMKYSDGGDQSLGTTDENGTLTTSALSTKDQSFTIYASGSAGMSYSYSSKCVGTTGKEDGKPYHIESGVSDDPTTMKNLVWMSNPSKAQKKAEVQYAEESAYTKDGEKAFKTTEGKTTLLPYYVSGVSNYTNSAVLSGLKPGTKYVFRVGDGTLWSDTGSFTTKSSPQEDGTDTTKFFVIGDTQTSGDDLSSLQNIISKTKTGYDFGVQLGDYVDNASNYSNWDDIQTPFDQLNFTDMLHVIGNHEKDGDADAVHANSIFNTKNRDYYSVTYGNVYVATIAYTSDKDKLQEAADWLEKDAAASNAQWKILVMHQPPYYTNGSGGNSLVNEIIPPACDKAGIDFVFSGHDHSYARTYPLYNRQEPDSVKEDSLNKGESYTGKGTIYYICGSTGEKSYPVSSNPDFHFAKADQDFNHGIYLSVTADNDKITVTTYDGDKVYDSFTKNSSCSADGHTYAYYKNGNAICSKCHKAFDITKIGKDGGGYTGWLKDQATDKNMYFIDGKMQTGPTLVGSTLYLFDENGLGETKTLKIAGTKYNFENGKYVSSSDADAGTIDFGYCGADSSVKGKNLIFAYQEGNKVLNVGLNPLLQNSSGKMTDWTHPTLVPWQAHRNDIVKANVGEGVTNLGNFFIYNAPSSAVKGLEDAVANLQEVNLPDSLTEIGDYALMDKANLKTVTIPKNVKKIGNMAFAFSKGIDVTCEGDTAISIDLLAFYDCGDTSALRVPESDSWTSAVASSAISFPGSIYIGGQRYIIPGGGGAAGGSDEKDIKALQESLKDAVSKAKAVDASKYTKDSAQALSDAVSGAETVLKKDNPTKDELSKAVSALTDAYNALKPVTDSGSKTSTIAPKNASAAVKKQFQKGNAVKTLTLSKDQAGKAVSVAMDQKSFPENSHVYVYTVGKNGKLTELNGSPLTVKDGSVQMTVKNSGTYALSSVPAANALRTVKITLAKPKHHAVYLRWTKADGADGYQIYRKTARGKYTKVKTVSNKYLHKTLKGLKSKKLYTFKVRAYVKVSGKTYYSHFSKGKSAIVK